MGKTYYAKGKKMWHYPRKSTIDRLIKNGYNSIVWQNGDFIEL